MILSIKGLCKERPAGGHEAYRLEVPKLQAAPGDKILITGPSGSGKSTFLDLLGMVLRPDAAERFYFFPGTQKTPGQMSPVKTHSSDTASSSPPPLQEQLGSLVPGVEDDTSSSLPSVTPPLDIARAWAESRQEDLAAWRRHIGYVLQTGGLLPFLTVRENINASRQLAGLPDDGSEEELAKSLDIFPLLNKMPSRLSVGERQRAAIARALAPRPPLVLADEPTAALDPGNADAVLKLFTDTVSALGVTLILVTHAPEKMDGMGFRRFEVRQRSSSSLGREAVLEEIFSNQDRAMLTGAK